MAIDSHPDPPRSFATRCFHRTGNWLFETRTSRKITIHSAYCQRMGLSAKKYSPLMDADVRLKVSRRLGVY